MPHDENQGSRLSLLLFYFLAFLLLWEWLRPLHNFTDTKHTGFFYRFYRFGISAVILPDEVVRHRAVLHSVYVDQYSHPVL